MGRKVKEVEAPAIAEDLGKEPDKKLGLKDKWRKWMQVDPYRPMIVFVFSMAVVVMVGTVLAILATNESVAEDRNRTDPTLGWVQIRDTEGDETGLQKICDGSTLIYENQYGSRSVTKELHSSECMR